VPFLLVLDVYGLRLQNHEFSRCEHVVRFSSEIVFVKQLEAGELNGFSGNVALVGAEFKDGFAPTVHVHDDLNFRVQLDVLVVLDHALRKPVNNQDFWRQVVVGGLVFFG